METKEFKAVFDTIARKSGFEKKYDGWFKESEECIIVLELQRSNFSRYYYLNIKCFIQGMFGNIYTKNKDLVKRGMGNVFTRQPNDYINVFDLEFSMTEEYRKSELERLFSEYVVPLTDRSLSRAGLKELEKQKELYILPAVMEQL